MVETWTTRDGQVIPIRDMTDSHLLNAIRFVRRNAGELRMREAYALDYAAETMGGDMAQDSLHAAAAQTYDQHDEDWLEEHEDYQALRREVSRRGLTAKLEETK